MGELDNVLVVSDGETTEYVDLRRMPDARVYHTQGGGLAKYDNECQYFYFIKAPAGFEPGDEVPEGWDVQ